MATEDTFHNQPEDSGTPDERIVKEAQRRFAVCATYENDARIRFIEDVKFANGDSDNLYQWDENARTARGYGTVDERPCLTINKVRQHNLNIINDARQNKPTVKVRPVGNGATYDAAQVFEGVVKHIEYISNAQAAYDTATKFQVEGGKGWLRLVTDYPQDTDQSFDQEIYIRRVKDPLTVYLDPDAREADKSDARYGFVFDDMASEVFRDTYPKYADKVNSSPLDVSGDWIRKDQIRVAEYYRVTEKDDKLVSYLGPDGRRALQRKSKMEDAEYKTAIEDPETKTRDVLDHKVEWYLIAGTTIVERNVWAGCYIPLIPVIGEETFINGQYDCKGHTRAMKDPQRLANYWYSAATEHVALQSKSPYIGAMAAFENLTPYWDSANTVNHAWLPFNAYDDKGQPIEPPQRQPPPIMPDAYIKGLELAAQEIREVSGQYQADMGMESNERSGVAIQQRQRQGDNATYHYIDHLGIALRYLGKQLIDLIPKVYDTRRIIKIMAEDGVEHEIMVDPNAQQAYQVHQQQQGQAVQSIFNPSVGRYDVEADIGPAYATRRQEAFDALTELMKGNPDLMHIAGDLLFKAADFPMSQDVAERIRATIPPNVIAGQPGPGPMQAEMQKQMQGLAELNSKLSQELSKLKIDRTIEQQQKEIDVYKAVTERMKIILPLTTSEADRAKMIHDLVMAEHENNLTVLSDTHNAMLSSMQSGQDHQQALQQGEAGHEQAMAQQAAMPQPAANAA